MSQLLVLFDQDDYQCVKAVRPDALQGSILAYELPLHLTLCEDRISHRTPWDYIGESDLNDIPAFHHECCDFWRRHASIPYEGIDLLKTCENRHTGFLARMAWGTYVLTKMIDDVRPDTIVVFEEPSSHGLPPPLEYRKIPALFMLLRGLAEQRGIQVDLITLDEQVERPVWSDRIAEAVQQEAAESCDIRVALDGRPFILFAGSGIDTIHHLPLINAVNQEGSRTALQLYRNVSKEYLGFLKDNGHLLFHDSQATAGAPVVSSADFAVSARQAFDEASANASGEMKAIFSNPWLQPHYDFIFGEYARRIAQQVENWNVFFTVNRPDLIVSSFPSIANDVAVSKGIPGLAMPHAVHPAGMLELLVQFDGFHLCANGQMARKSLVSMNIPQERVHVAVDEVVDAFRKKRKTESQQRRDQIRESGRTRYSVSEQGRLILVLSGGYVYGTMHSGIDFPDWQSSDRMFEQLGHLARSRPDWHWLYRPHPRFDEMRVWEHATACAMPGQLMSDSPGLPLYDQVQAADAIVLVGAGTSVQLEAPLMRPIPIYMMKPCLPWYHPEKYNLDKWPLLPSVDALELELDWLFSDEKNWQSRADRVAELTEEYFGEGEPMIEAWLKIVNDVAVAGSGNSLAGRSSS